MVERLFWEEKVGSWSLSYRTWRILVKLQPILLTSVKGLQRIDCNVWEHGVGWSARMSEEHEVTVRFRVFPLGLLPDMINTPVFLEYGRVKSRNYLCPVSWGCELRKGKGKRQQLILVP